MFKLVKAGLESKIEIEIKSKHSRMGCSTFSHKYRDFMNRTRFSGYLQNIHTIHVKTCEGLTTFCNILQIQVKNYITYLRKLHK